MSEIKFKPLQVAYYHPTPSYREITEHISLCWDDMTLVAVCGASEACEDAEIVKETRAYARLFAAAPNMLEALTEIEDLCDEMMGDWSCVSFAYLPEGMEKLYELREIARAAIKTIDQKEK